MKKPLVLGLAMALAGTAGAFAADELILPEHPGTDMLDATKARFQVMDTLGQTHDIGCAGPTMIGRGAPDPVSGTIPTEILELSLHCGNGVTVHQDPRRPSMGQISKNGDSFFDVFVEIDGFPTPDGGTTQVTNVEPARVQA